MKRLRISIKHIVLLAVLMLVGPGSILVHAHCDTMKGPVVQDARNALETGDIKPVLKWIGPQHETELRERFRQAVTLRKQGELAREVADRFFFEAAVRLHRAFEQAPYTGLKEDDAHVPTFIKQLDKALESGDIDPVLDRILGHTRETIRNGFDQTRKLRQSSEDNVQAGREYVEQYVRFIHHVKAIVDAVHGETGHAIESKSHKCD